MQLTSLTLDQIGPFDHAELALQTRDDGPGVTFVTGENGTGKSVVLDAIRTVFGEQWTGPMRDVRRGVESKVRLWWSSPPGSHRKSSFPTRLNRWDAVLGPNGRPPVFVLDYWQSALAVDSFSVSALEKPVHEHYLHGALSGRALNATLTQQLCYFDYLRDSRTRDERERGEAAWAAIERIVEVAVAHGSLQEVRRASLEPVVRVFGRDLTLDKVAAGSLYVMSRMLRLLARMHSCQVVGGHTGPVTDVPGWLLIDEPEDHLHPKWQKRFLADVRAVFPNLQIIAATHSPFVLTSVKGAAVYRCRALDDGTGCVIEDVSQDYASQGVDEILLSEAFSGTLPYGPEIDALLERHRRAVETGDVRERERVEAELLRRNPTEFAGLEFTSRLAALADVS